MISSTAFKFIIPVIKAIVNSINQNASLAQFQYLLNDIEPYLDQLSPQDRKYVRDFMRRYRDARKRNDKDTLDKLGKEFLETISKKFEIVIFAIVIPSNL